MWLVVLSDQLLIVALVGLYPANKLINHRPLRLRQALRSPAFTLRSYAVLANLSAGCPPQTDTFRCITHPFATRRQEQAPALPFDLHVLGMPPAFILSQDQTLHFDLCYFWSYSLTRRND